MLIICRDCNQEKEKYNGKRCYECFRRSRNDKDKQYKESGAIITCRVCGLDKPKYSGLQCYECIMQKRLAKEEQDRQDKILIICRDCGLEKEKHKGKRCKKCFDKNGATKAKKRRDNNPEQAKKTRDKYYNNNKDKINAKKKARRKENQPEILDSPEEIKQKRKEKRKQQHNERCRKRYEEDIFYRLRVTVTNSINRMLKDQNSSKEGSSTTEYLPWNIDVLWQHLESKMVAENAWMNRSNHGKYIPETWREEDQSTWTWQLDHIIPQSDLPYASMEDENFKKCWALENLRPLPAKQNIIDGTKRTRHKS